ncbi:dehydrogenase/reductase SDR family member on chromosome X-like isoform X2 [Orbicella faveolata]|nr:dehydrogenase/reductase SDR family member on chromosome X-like isoform X2 [Orbicella faveolata]
MKKEHEQSTEKSKSGDKSLNTAEAEGKEVQEREPGTSHQLLLEYMHLDLSSLSSTVEFVVKFKQTGYPLHVLICNAGIAFANQGLTADGFETHFQVNYLSHLLLVLKLLPVMKQSVNPADARVIFVSSRMERWRGEFNLANIQGQLSYDRTKFYSMSKLYMVMIMFYLHKHLVSQGITFCALHPGVVNTEITRSFQDLSFLKNGFKVMNVLGMLETPERGAMTTINCAVNPELAGVSGVYYINCKPAQPSQLARNEHHQDALWKYSIECLKDYVDENLLFECGFLINESEVKELLSSK